MERLELTVPSSLEAVYRDWGEPPSPARPLMQGDVFRDINIPGINDGTRLAIVSMHPCSMRLGIQLRKRITLLPVQKRSGAGQLWKTGIRFMPLPKLEGPDTEQDFIADLCDPVSFNSADLDLSNRILTLNDDGIFLFQQRLICFQARLVANLDELYNLNFSVLTEMELQEDWGEYAIQCSQNESDTETVEAAGKAFQTWLDEEFEDCRRRDMLKLERKHSALRKDSRAAMKLRLGS